METRDAVRERRSIRQFLSKPVPEETIREIVSDALWAPSWGNTQPWEIFAVTGAALEHFKKENQETFFSGKAPNPEISIPMEWPEAQKTRYKGIGKSVLGALSIAREDQEGRIKYAGEMYSFFNTPALLMLVVDKELSLEYAMLDIGIVLQTVCLLAQDRGLGTCILAASIFYPDISRKLFSIPDDKRIVIGTALGWPDTEAPINRFERTRGSLDELVKWVK
ncbi:MAG: nitroreductase [Proteobacteria bacterium]|nr:nitroreductase [Pseudomonadota bacterium]